MRLFGRWCALAGVTVALLWLVAGLAALAIAFVSVAFYLELAKRLGPPLAALSTGGALAAVALLLLVALIFALSRRRAPAPPPQPDGQAAAGRLGALLGEEAGTLTRQHPATAMLVALTAGFVVGMSPKARAWLMRLLR